MNREELIRDRAYQLWEEAGSPPGDGIDFWLIAENQWESEFQTADASPCNIGKAA